MPTENRSSNTEQMVSVPRADVVEMVKGARSMGWSLAEKLSALLAQPAAQHQGEPVGWTYEDGKEYTACPDHAHDLRAEGIELTPVYRHPPVQSRGEPVAYQRRCKTVNEGSQWRHWVDCTEEDYRKTIENPGPNPRGIIREARKLYTHADVGEVERLHNGHVKSLEALNQQTEKQRDHWMAECDTLRAQVIEANCEIEKLRAKLAELDVLLREAIGDADARNFFGQATLDRITEILSASAEPSAPVERGPWQPITAPGQIQEGDWLSFTVAGGFICAQARLIINPGTPREEIIYNRKKNHYFVTSMAIDGSSTHKGVLVAKAQA
ncbi:hypothetical protein [Pseudomonas fluorescens]|uniref:Uncharacterized protein n=1 Tax=Pseudomonas fluorescens TaxID=294 RepID=A0A5E6RAF1_PSEFL|nr:hypothetical protein [Pseudomonas fluorescens]VVM65784.1 hypothetical protein PS652_01517 [Pseudomonas fluorescens]